jgi:hypothetical protein
MSLRDEVLLIGVGELGATLGAGLLRAGCSVTPVRRGESSARIAYGRDPGLVLCAVAEADLEPALASLPRALHHRLALLQNELAEGDLARYGAASVLVVWFEKKPGSLPRVLAPSLGFGPGAPFFERALRALDLPYRTLGSREELAAALALKNLYILSTNLAGLRVGGDVAGLARDHGQLLEAVLDDVAAVEAARSAIPLDLRALRRELPAIFAADPHHRCAGRTAPARLRRTLARAEALGVEVPTLRSLSVSVAVSVSSP